VATGHFMVLLGQRLASCCNSFLERQLANEKQPKPGQVLDLVCNKG
jgi:hypothetical protein